MVKELVCPNCGTPLQINEDTYASLAKQVRDAEFELELEKRATVLEAEKKAAVKLAEANAKAAMKDQISQKDLEIQKLQDEKVTMIKNTAKDIIMRNNKYNALRDDSLRKIEELQKIIDLNDSNLKLAVSTAVNEAVIKEKENNKCKDIRIAQMIEEAKNKEIEKTAEISKLKSECEKSIITLQNEITKIKSENSLAEKDLRDRYDATIKDLNNEIEYYKSYKAKLSVKLLGESLEEHCSTEYESIRPLLPNATFEKDNTLSEETGSKGDFIFRGYDPNGIEIISIMFEMKNEADDSSNKHKNDDFLKKLDRDRNEKKCEYAVLVSMLEPESELYNRGIVDVSHKYEKMYVIRPQFFVPMITLLLNSAKNTLKYKEEIAELRHQSIDVSTFESDLEDYKGAVAKCFELASKNKESAINRVDKAIKLLQEIREDLTKIEKHEEAAVKKAEQLTIKKITKKNATIADLLEKAADTNCNGAAEECGTDLRADCNDDASISGSEMIMFVDGKRPEHIPA